MEPCLGFFSPKISASTNTIFHPLFFLSLSKGQELWYMRYHMPLVNISLPRKLPDLDGDRISELVAACAVTFPSEMTDNRVHVRTNFILISGHHGKVMGRPYEVDTCTDIGAINVTSTLALQFDCTSQHGGKSLETTPIGRKFVDSRFLGLIWGIFPFLKKSLLFQYY